MDDADLLDVQESIITGVFDGEKLVSASQMQGQQFTKPASIFIDRSTQQQQAVEAQTQNYMNPYTNPYCAQDVSMTKPDNS